MRQCECVCVLVEMKSRGKSFGTVWKKKGIRMHIECYSSLTVFTITTTL